MAFTDPSTLQGQQLRRFAVIKEVIKVNISIYIQMKTTKTCSPYRYSTLLKNTIHTQLVNAFLMADDLFLAQVCCPKPKQLMSSPQPPRTPLAFAPRVPPFVLTLSYTAGGQSLDLDLILPTPHLLSMDCTKLFRNNFLEQVLVIMCFT